MVYRSLELHFARLCELKVTVIRQGLRLIIVTFRTLVRVESTAVGHLHYSLRVTFRAHARVERCCNYTGVNCSLSHFVCIHELKDNILIL